MTSAGIDTDAAWQPVAGTDVEVRVRTTHEGGRLLWPSVGEYPVYDDFLYYVMVHRRAALSRRRR